MKKVTVPVVIILIVIVAAQTVPAVVPAALPAGQAAPAGAPAVGPLAAVALVLSLGGDSPQPCSMKGACSMTPTPQMRIAVVIDDDIGWREIFAEIIGASGFTVIRCPTFCDDPQASVFVVDAQDPNGIVVGPGFVKTIRASHPDAVIIGISGNLDFIQAEASLTVRAQFIAAGANVAWDKSDFSIAKMRSLLP